MQILVVLAAHYIDEILSITFFVPVACQSGHCLFTILVLVEILDHFLILKASEKVKRGLSI